MPKVVEARDMARSRDRTRITLARWIVGPNYAQGNLKMAGVQQLEMLVIIACTLLGVLLLGGLTALVVWLIKRASKNKANRRGDDEKPSDGNKPQTVASVDPGASAEEELARLKKRVQELEDEQRKEAIQKKPKS
jgi:hypothetical protein